MTSQHSISAMIADLFKAPTLAMAHAGRDPAGSFTFHPRNGVEITVEPKAPIFADGEVFEFSSATLHLALNGTRQMRCETRVSNLGEARSALALFARMLEEPSTHEHDALLKQISNRERYAETLRNHHHSVVCDLIARLDNANERIEELELALAEITDAFDLAAAVPWWNVTKSIRAKRTLRRAIRPHR